ncbi:MAG: hypothetical protein ABF747_06265 [Bifidobacterium sp.]|uniref:HTH cro/C1-type domain-containing protein n=1 Tax=Bifidobacterium fermentum TaxID=3059035 RepID=A0AB39UHY3_9BIFI
MVHTFDKRVAERINVILSDRNMPTKQERCGYLKAKITDTYHSDMGISTASLHNILSGRTPLTLERAIVIANSLNIPIGNLLADPERPNSSSIKSTQVPEMRYEKNYMILQQCRFTAVEYENLDVVDIKRKIRTNLKHLLLNNHEVWANNDYSTAKSSTSAAGTMHAGFKVQKPIKRKTKCLITSERFFSYITTSYYHDSMSFRPQTLYNIAEGTRSLQLREALVVIHVFDCNIDFKRGAIFNSRTRYTKREIQSILRVLSVACDEIEIINQKIKDFQISQTLKRREKRINLDFTYTDVIHQKYPQLRRFSSNEAASLALIMLDKKLDAPEWSPNLFAEMDRLIDLQNDRANDHQLLSPLFGYHENFPECTNYSRRGKGGFSQQMRCPLCTLVNGAIHEIEQLSKDDVHAITKMIRGQFQIIYSKLFWDNTPEYLTRNDSIDHEAIRQTLIQDQKLFCKLADCFKDTKCILGEALSTEFPQLNKLLYGRLSR